MDPSIALTLTLIAAVESNSGTNLAHKVIRSPASIHYGEAAVGRYGLMPATLRQLGTQDEERAAKRLIARIRAKQGTRCPWVTLIAWQYGPNHVIGARDWVKAKRRINRARLEMKGGIKWSLSAPRSFLAHL